jgi:hypothetical protein
MGLKKHPSVPASVPLITDVVKDKEVNQILKLKMAAYETGYPVYAPPGVPAARVAILRKAFAATYRDPEYLSDAKRSRVEIGPISGEEVSQIVSGAYGAPEAIKARLRAASNIKTSKIGRAKTKKVSSAITAIKKKGKVIQFKAKGKTIQARLGRKTKIYIGGKKVKRKSLKVGLNCQIVYFFDGSQAKSIKCK